MKELRALSVRQPWAELIARGAKTLELRSWRTNYKGPLIICSSQNLSDFVLLKPQERQGFGAIGVTICLVDLVEVRPFLGDDDDARAAGLEKLARLAGRPLHLDPAHHPRWAWKLERPRRLPARPVAGKLGLFRLSLPSRPLPGTDRTCPGQGLLFPSSPGEEGARREP